MGYGNALNLDLFTKKISIETKNQEKTVESFPVDIFAASPISLLSEIGDSSPFIEYINNSKTPDATQLISTVLDRQTFSTFQTVSAELPLYVSFYSTDSNLWNNETTHTSTISSENIFIEDSSPGITILEPLGSLGIAVGDVNTGEAVYTTPGTYSWTCPAGVTSVSAVCVGSGGTGGWQWSSGGGGGGGLGWKNNIPVTPGQTYTVVVGASGPALVNNTTSSSAMGNNSYFIDVNTVCGFGAGRGGTDATGTGQGGYGGGYTGDGGGRGGNGAYNGAWNLAGGGAGGYTGRGGDGGVNSTSGDAGQGGGGGAGGWYSSTWGTPGGGGVGIYGQGASGGNVSVLGEGGKGGSGGQDGHPGEPITNNNISSGDITGGNFGGGGGGSGTSAGGGPGGTGAVRIMWGGGLSFPTNAGAATPYIDSGTLGDTLIIYDSIYSPVISYDDSYYTLRLLPASQKINIDYASADSYASSEPTFSPITSNTKLFVEDSAQPTLVLAENKLFIKTQKSISDFVGVNSASKLVTFVIENDMDFIYTEQEGSKIEEVNAENDPRPIVVSQEVAEQISTGPVQSWF